MRTTPTRPSIRALPLVIAGAILMVLIGCRGDMSSLIVHYHRYDNQYAGWSLWTWLDQVSLDAPAFKQDGFGLVFKIELKEYPPKGNIGLLPKRGNWLEKDDPNRFWSRNLPGEIWILQGDEKLYITQPDTQPIIRQAFLDSPTEVLLVFSHPVVKQIAPRLNPIITLSNTVKIQPIKVQLMPANADSSNLIRLITSTPLDPAHLPAEVRAADFEPCPIQLRRILDSPKYVSNVPLGAFYTPKATRFAVFAPGATAVHLQLYTRPKGGRPRSVPLQQMKTGIWSATVAGDLKGQYYVYTVAGPDPAYVPDQEVIDPYARCVTTHDGRALIFHDETPVADSPVFPIQDAVIYEIHVRDFTISENSGMRYKGKYLGFAEEGTRLPGTDLSTGLDHLTELGINTVQLLPVQDFEHDNQTNSYFWGYMTVNFNSPDGWYTTNEDDASRIVEFKQMISKLHQRGIKVILDVVYNHTAETNPQVRYNFNGLVPNFYYRQKPDGSYWNGSGCGNEVRSEQPMVRRFILESLKYWVETFKVDGFRFDLMGLIDLATLQTIVRELRAIKPDIFLYGEPWTAGETPIRPTVKGHQRGEGFAVFNDNFRDALKGPWYNTEPGYVQTGKNVEQVKKGIMGSITDFADSPTEVINYVSCHDGRTLWDLLVASTSGMGLHTDTELKAMDKLAAFIIFTSQGIPFMQGGEEFLRTKFGSHNSYNQPDKINKIRWDYKQENYDIFQYYKGLIALRQAHPMFRLTEALEIKRNLTFLEQLGYAVPEHCIAYRLQRGTCQDKWREVLILINPNRESVTFKFPKNKWILAVDHTQVRSDIIAPVNASFLAVKPISAVLMYRL